jgi:hypothetical protein
MSPPEGTEMADDEAKPEPETDVRRRPTRRADTEQAIGLEVAKLFGLSPRSLMAPRSKRPESDEPAEHEGSAEHEEPTDSA